MTNEKTHRCDGCHSELNQSARTGCQCQCAESYATLGTPGLPPGEYLLRVVQPVKSRGKAGNTFVVEVLEGQHDGNRILLAIRGGIRPGLCFLGKIAHRIGSNGPLNELRKMQCLGFEDVVLPAWRISS
jgi:hypothetical protein